jgi:endonuclease I
MHKYIFLSLSIFIASLAMAQIPSGYYDNAKGQSGTNLKKELHRIIRGHTTVSYTQLWTSFQSTDKKSNGYVWDMYSDVPGGTPSYNFSYTSDQCGTYSGEGSCYNREHSFPKSWWGGGTSSSDTMYTDLFHLVPTDGYVNSQRSSYPYGEVGTASWTSSNGSKLGTSNYPGYSGTVFEPIDDYKGDFARNYLYMATRYLNRIDSWGPNSDMLDGSGFSSWAINLLLDWNHQDPVSQKELDRNDNVYAIQNNRNPFIDHPEFVQRIWGGYDDYAPYFYDSYPSSANIASVSFDLVVSLDETCTVYYVVLADGATAPSSAQVVAGKDASGSLLASNLRGSITVSSSNTEFSSNITSLSTTTAYDVYVVAEDNASPTNTQASPSKLDVTTGSGGSSGSSGSIVVQSFESGTWNYTATAGSGTIAVTTSKHQDGSSSLELTGSNSANSDPYVVFDNVDISSYTSVSLELAFAADGPDGSDDLYLDISYDNGTTWNGTGSVKLVDGYGNASVAFGTTNSSNPTTVGSNPYSISIADAETQIRIRIRFDERSGKNNTSDSYFVDAIKLSGTSSSSNSNESDIIIFSGWSEPTDIDYTSYLSASGLTSANAIEVAKFTIRDGGSDNTDLDGLSTILTDLNLSVQNWENIAALAIMDAGGNNIGEQTTINSSSVDFNSINSGSGIEATDESIESFSVYATFKSTVTDHDNLQFSINSTSVDASGSSFASTDAGGATTDATGNNNEIVVTATKLAFTTNKPPSSVNVNNDFDVEVESVDSHNNRDIDGNSSISLAVATGSGILSSITGLNQSLVNGVYSWSDIQYDTEESFSISASTTGLSTITSASITASSSAPVTYFSDLIITEYVEGSSNNKYLELWNNTGANVALNNYRIDIYANGSSSSSTSISLTGTLNDQDVFVIANSSAVAWSGTPDLSTGSLNFNGNDAVVLVNTSAKGNVDVIGTIGSASYFAQDETLKRNGDISGPSSTYNSADWTTYAVDNVDGLGNPGPLPVELLSCSAEIYNDNVILKWQTASEVNNDYFSVERSYNAKDFEEIAQVQGAGNSNQIQNYKYLDQNADVNQSIYYRLKQIDYNGVYTYSDIVAVNAPSQGFKLDKSYSVDGELNLEINSNFNTHSQFQLMDITGKILYSKYLNIDKGMHNYRISLANYASGIYFIRITTENGLYVQDKLILQ